MSMTITRRAVRRSALSFAAVALAASGLAGCSPEGGGCPEEFIELVTEQSGEGVEVQEVPASAFPVEEMRGALRGGCIVSGSEASGDDAGVYYLGVAAAGVSAQEIGDAATSGGFEWSDDGGTEAPYGQYFRGLDPSDTTTGEYLFLQGVDAGFIGDVGAFFEEGQVALFYQDVAATA